MLGRILVVMLVAAVFVAILSAADSGSSPTTRPATRAALPAADNSYCLTCHINFQKEVLANEHRKVGVGCDKCHGESDKHSSDENGITPPDIMFPRPTINASCIKCHDVKQLAKEKTGAHDPWLPNAQPEEKPSYCTDCHGKHTMPVRTRRWDKATGKLIADDGVRMVDDKAGVKK